MLSAEGGRHGVSVLFCIIGKMRRTLAFFWDAGIFFSFLRSALGIIIGAFYASLVFLESLGGFVLGTKR